MLCLLLHTGSDRIEEYSPTCPILSHIFYLRKQQVVLSALLTTSQILLTYALKKLSQSPVVIFLSLQKGFNFSLVLKELGLIDYNWYPFSFS